MFEVAIAVVTLGVVYKLWKGYVTNKETQTEPVFIIQMSPFPTPSTMSECSDWSVNETIFELDDVDISRSDISDTTKTE